MKKIVYIMLFFSFSILFFNNCTRKIDCKTASSSNNASCLNSGGGSVNTPLAITKFTINNIPGKISGNIITIITAYNVNLTNLVASFETNPTNATVTIGSQGQVSGTTANDFSKGPLTYTLTSADGKSTENYITVKNALNPAKSISNFSIIANDGVTPIAGQISGQNIQVKMPYNTTNLSQLVAVFTTNPIHLNVKVAEQIQTSGTTKNNFSQGPVIYIVTAEDGSTTSYQVTVSVAKNTDAEILDYFMNGATSPAIPSLSNQPAVNNVTVPIGTDVTKLVANFTCVGSKITVIVDGKIIDQVSGVTPNDFTNDVIYNVTSADSGSVKNYEIHVNISKASDAEILGYNLKGATSPTIPSLANQQINNVTMSVGANVTNLIATFGYIGSKITVTVGGVTSDQISGNTHNDFTSDITYTVTAADGITTKNYTVHVIVPLPPVQTVSASIYFNNNHVKSIEAQQGTVIPLKILFQSTIFSQKLIVTTNSDDPNVSPATSNCTTDTSSGSCEVTINYKANDVSRQKLQISYSYPGNPKKQELNLTMKVDAWQNNMIPIGHGKINTLTWKDAENLLVNSDEKSSVPNPEITSYLNTVSLPSKSVVNNDYPLAHGGVGNISYSSPLVYNKSVIFKSVSFSGSFFSYLGIDKTYLDYYRNAEKSGGGAPFVAGIKTAPIYAFDNLPGGDSYYILTIGYSYQNPSNLSPFLMRISGTTGVPNPNYYYELDPLTGTQASQITDASTPLLKVKDNIFFKVNYNLLASGDSVPSPKLYMFDTFQKSFKSVSIQSTQSNLVTDNNYLFVGDDTGVIHVYDSSGDEISNKFKSISNSIDELVLSSDNKTIYALTNTGVYSFDLTYFTSTTTISSNYNYVFSNQSHMSSSSDMILAQNSKDILYAANGSVVYALNSNNISNELWDSTFSYKNGIIVGDITAITSDNVNVYAGSQGNIYSFPFPSINPSI